MRIAVAGATGNIGARTVVALERDGHDVVRMSRSLGVDLVTGEGLDTALHGVDAVIDVTNGPAGDRAAAVAHFGTATRNPFGPDWADGARLATTTFDEWLEGELANGGGFR